jgi:hypothetical protein
MAKGATESKESPEVKVKSPKKEEEKKIKVPRSNSSYKKKGFHKGSFKYNDFKTIDGKAPKKKVGKALKALKTAKNKRRNLRRKLEQ